MTDNRIRSYLAEALAKYEEAYGSHEERRAKIMADYHHEMAEIEADRRLGPVLAPMKWGWRWLMRKGKALWGE